MVGQKLWGWNDERTPSVLNTTLTPRHFALAQRAYALLVLCLRRHPAVLAAAVDVHFELGSLAAFSGPYVTAALADAGFVRCINSLIRERSSARRVADAELDALFTPVFAPADRPVVFDFRTLRFTPFSLCFVAVMLCEFDRQFAEGADERSAVYLVIRHPRELYFAAPDLSQVTSTGMTLAEATVHYYELLFEVVARYAYAAAPAVAVVILYPRGGIAQDEDGHIQAAIDKFTAQPAVDAQAIVPFNKLMYAVCNARYRSETYNPGGMRIEMAPYERAFDAVLAKGVKLTLRRRSV